MQIKKMPFLRNIFNFWTTVSTKNSTVFQNPIGMSKDQYSVIFLNGHVSGQG